MTETDTNDLMQAVKQGLTQAVRDRLVANYGDNLFVRVLNNVVEQQTPHIKTLLLEGVNSALGDEVFREEIKTAIRHKLAKVLVERFGGELEKAVNTLKSDPATRARITLAIDEIVREKTK